MRGRMEKYSTRFTRSLTKGSRTLAEPPFTLDLTRSEHEVKQESIGKSNFSTNC
jgi:hypothetical protein